MPGLTNDQIMAKYKALHEELRLKRYVDKTLSPADHDIQQAAMWQAYEAELINNGYLPPPVDYKAAYNAAATIDAKLSIIAKSLGLEG